VLPQPFITLPEHYCLKTRRWCKFLFNAAFILQLAEIDADHANNCKKKQVAIKKPEIICL